MKWSWLKEGDVVLYHYIEHGPRSNSTYLAKVINTQTNRFGTINVHIQDIWTNDPMGVSDDPYYEVADDDDSYELLEVVSTGITDDYYIKLAKEQHPEYFV